MYGVVHFRSSLETAVAAERNAMLETFSGLWTEWTWFSGLLLLMLVLLPYRLTREYRQVLHLCTIVLILLLAIPKLSLPFIKENLLITAVVLGLLLYLPLGIWSLSQTRRRKKGWQTIVQAYDLQHQIQYSLLSPPVEMIETQWSNYQFSI